MRYRDNQKARLYLAERVIQENKYPVSGKKLKPMTIAECQKFVDRVLRRKSIIKVYGYRSLVVVAGRGGGRAFGYRAISLGVWARQPVVILHEIAHHLAGFNAQHGPEFATVMLKLVRTVLGKEDYEKLLGSYAFRGVKIVGKSGKAQKARCPQSRKAWLEEETKKRKEWKERRKEILNEQIA